MFINNKYLFNNTVFNKESRVRFKQNYRRTELNAYIHYTVIVKYERTYLILISLHAFVLAPVCD